MPIITGVDHDRHEVNVLAVGPVTVDDVLEHLQHQKREHGLSYPKLVESRGAEVPIELTDFQQITELTRALSLESPIGPTAVVVSSVSDLEALRVLEGMMQSFCEIKAFRNEAEARAWLRERTAKSRSA
jgi:stage II sporulation SpoAA-like protein